MDIYDMMYRVIRTAAIRCLREHGTSKPTEDQIGAEIVRQIMISFTRR